MTWPGLPVLVKLAGRPVILLGKGEAADAKRQLLERAGAVIMTDTPDARFAIVAIEDEAQAQAAVARLRARGILINAVDRPALCDFTLPAVVDRSPVLVAVATGGVSAGLAAALRQRLELFLPASLGRLAEALGSARGALRARYPDAVQRRRAVGAALAGPLDPLGPDAFAGVETVLLGNAEPAPAGEDDTGRAAKNDGGPRETPGVTICLTSPDPDDLTLRQARALALADRVLHAPAVPAAILARARADAPRIALAARPSQVAAGDVWVEVLA